MLDSMRMVHTSRKEMRCVFFALVIRRAALKEKYEGGLPAFMDKYHAKANKHLVVRCVMSGAYLDEPCRDITNSGLKFKEDFLCVEAMNIWGDIVDEEEKEKYGLAGPFNVNESDWLKGCYKDGGMMVWYTGR